MVFSHAACVSAVGIIIVWVTLRIIFVIRNKISFHGREKQKKKREGKEKPAVYFFEDKHVLGGWMVVYRVSGYTYYGHTE